MSAIQAYIRETAPRGRESERIGPFLATYCPGLDNPFLNYAIPDDGARPSPAEIGALTEAYRGRGLLPRLEYFTETAPELEKLLVAQGYSLERRVALMICGPDDRIDRTAPAGVTLRAPRSRDDHRRLRSVQNVAFGQPAEVSETEVHRSEDTVDAGGIEVLAEDTTSGDVIGGGLALEIVGGTTEIAGIAVAEPYRKRGIAAAITAYLTREAHGRGAHTAFLTPGDDGIGNVYARVGYRPTGECVHLSLT